MSMKVLYLFKMARRGYDPEEVLSCVQKLIQMFSARLAKSEELAEQWRGEADRLKRQVGEDHKCIEELERQNRQLREENRKLRQSGGASSAAGAESDSPGHGTSGF